MKSTRVTKLLACTLSIAMCTTPVWASSTQYKDDSKAGSVGGTIEAPVGPYSPIVSVNVPTKTKIEINPLISENSTSVNGFGIASRDLIITNKSYDSDRNSGTAVVVTAEAELTEQKTGVKMYYEKGTRSGYTPSVSSSAKEAYMTISQASLQAGTSANATYANANNKTDVVTTAGSQIQFSVSGPSAVGNKTYGGFAIVGDANVNADWQNDDIKVALTYNIKAGNSGMKAKPTIASTGISVVQMTASTSQNGISINNVPKTGIDGAEIDKIVIHDAKAGCEDWVLDAFDETQVQWKENAAGTQYTLTIPVSDDLKWYVEEYTPATKAGKLDILLHLTDGRVLKTDLL